MVATIPTDFPVALAAGALTACVQARYVRAKRPDLLTGRVARIGLLSALYYGVSVGYFLWKYPAWMYAYAVDPAHLSPFVAAVGFVPSMALTGLSGAMIAQALIERGRLSLAIALGVFALALNGFVLWALEDSFNHVGTFAEYRAGAALAMNDPAHGTFQTEYLVAAVLQAVPAIALIAFLVREAMRLGRATPPSASVP